MDNAANLVTLPDDSQALKAMLRTLIEERDQEKQRADKHQQRADREARRSDELRVEMLRLQLELERYKKWYYGPRADRLQSSADLAQMLLTFAEEMDRKPVNPDDVPPRTDQKKTSTREASQGAAQSCQLRKSSCNYSIHELSAAERACPCCGASARDRRGIELAGRVYPWPLRAHRALQIKYACKHAKHQPITLRSGGGASRCSRSTRAWPGRACWPMS